MDETAFSKVPPDLRAGPPALAGGALTHYREDLSFYLAESQLTRQLFARIIQRTE